MSGSKRDIEMMEDNKKSCDGYPLNKKTARVYASLSLHGP